LKPILPILALIVLALGCATTTGEDWQPLFNGKDLTGWTQHGGKAAYSVENGEIVGRAVPGTPNSFLCTERAFANFILELEFKPMTGLNSGIQFRSHVSAGGPADAIEWQGRTNRPPKGRVYGYQAEIDPSDRAWTAGLYEEGRRGWLQNLTGNEPARKAFKANAWNTLRIECRGDSIKTFLNGVPAADAKDSGLASGFIGLQVHGIGQTAKELEIRWRNLRIQELP